MLALLPGVGPCAPLPPALTAALGLAPDAAVQLSIRLSTGRVARLTVLRNRHWVELVSVLAGDEEAAPLSEDERTEATAVWVEATVRRVRGARASSEAFVAAERAASRLTASLGLHHSDLAVLLRAPDHAAVIHPVAGRTSAAYGDPAPRTAETLRALETLVLPAPLEEAAAALSALADAHRGWARGSAPERIASPRDATAFVDHLSATQRSFDEAAALALLQTAGPGPWFLARPREAEAGVRVLAVRPTLAVVLDLHGDGP